MVWVLCLALLLALVVAATPLTAPITHVTVFGDRARVVRSTVLPAGPLAVTFPVLPETVDRDSIRVEVQDDSLSAIEIIDVPEEAFPVGPGSKLLAQIEALDDQLAALAGTEQAVESALEALRGVAPQPPPPSDRQPPRPLDPGNWPAAIEIAKTTESTLRERLRELGDQQRALAEQREHVGEQARELGAHAHPGGTLVRATVRGGGRATLSYEVRQATWTPRYDIQLDPGKGEARVSLAGVVTQTTGEDWTNTALELSTALPATARIFPELPVWKIGERERFIPTPQPRPLPVAPAPVAPPLVTEADPGARVRGELLRLADSQPSVATESAPTPAAPPEMDIERESNADSGGLNGSGAGRAQKYASAPHRPAPPAPPPPQPVAVGEPEGARMESMETFSARPDTIQAAPLAQRLALGPPIEQGPLRPTPDSPAAHAGGYDLRYPSLRTETIPSGTGARRVALFSRTFPVSLTRAVYPALTEAAFLVAELSNPSADPLPSGEAELFVGDDPSGTAQLPLVAPGERFTLPLGLDQSVHPVRRVDLVQGESGLFSKDDVREYKVTIELGNPYDHAIDVHLVDQWPVTHDAHVNVALGRVEPKAETDPVKGQLDWRLTLPASSKRSIVFSFTVRSPKGWRLAQ